MWAKSLRRELLFWMLVPLVCVALFNVWTSYRGAVELADLTADRALLASARAIAENISTTDGNIESSIPPSALEIFVSNVHDRVAFQVKAPNGQLLAGNPEIEAPPDVLNGMAPAYFYTLYRNSLVRAVALAQPIFSTKIGGMATVIVVQTRAGHDALVRSLLVKALRDQLLFGAVAISLALFGLGRGLAPLAKLSRQIQLRDARNLAPLPVSQVQREMRPLVEALNSALQRVEAQVAAQRRFVANAAHQIRTPLALLKTQSLVGRQARSKDEKNEALSAIGKNVDGLSRLATQLLTLARSEQGSALLRKDKVDINAIVRGAVETMLPVSFDRNIDLGFEGGEAPIMIFGHSGLLHEAVVNLIDNALRYTPQGGAVTARIREVGELVVIVVEDSGPGIAPQDREGVFERFQRGAGQVGEGSGLGLAIVKEIASAHLGTVELSERDPPPGLLVRLTLPAMRE